LPPNKRKMSDKEKRDRKPTGGTGRSKQGKFSGNPDDKRSSYSGAEGERNPFQRRKRITTGNTGASSDRPKRSFDNREDKPRFRDSNEGARSGSGRTERPSSGPSTFHKTEGTGEGRPPYRSRSTDDKPSFRTERPARNFEDRGPRRDTGSGKPEDRPYRSRSTDDKPSFRTERPARNFEDRGPGRDTGSGKPEDRPYRSRSTDDKPSFRTERPARNFEDRGPKRDAGSGKPEDRPYRSRGTDDKPKLRNDSPFKKFEIKKKPEKKGEGRRSSFGQAKGSDDRRPKPDDRPSYRSRGTDDKPSGRPDRPARKFEGKSESGERAERPRSFEGRKGTGSGRSNTNRFSNRRLPASKVDGTGIIRLNKFLADAGVCSRREADVLILAGTVTVNGQVVTEMGMKVSVNDKVMYGGQTLNRETLRYVLLNKPKGYITTSDDPYERKTVMELVANACTERIYPVGRLDRNTTGLLLFTNDGELAKKLMAPRHNVSKLYHVELDKPLTKSDLLKIAAGIELEDGVAEVDEIAWVTDAESKKEVGIKIHSGKNRIVRRIFESIGYEVIKLDRVIFAGLTKLNLTRGKYRHLTPKEIASLQSVK
jgi:23S rRNA pseudouridine2605 synthase